MELYGLMKLSNAIQGFLIHKSAEGKSERTLRDYKHQLESLCTYLGDLDVDQIDTTALRAFLDYLRNEYQPKRMNGDSKPLSQKTLRNYWITLRSFVSWSMVELGTDDVLRPIKPPEFKLPEIEPLTRSEVQAILQACKHTRKAETDQRRSFEMRRPTALRDRALILLLLDTGLRAAECARLKVGDVDLTTGAVIVRSHNSGRKSKPRIVYLGKTARHALWRYLASRDVETEDPLFATTNGLPLGRDGIRFLCRRTGKRAGIQKPCYPQRFRHTFAITYLRNGGDIYTLQQQLGHASLQMVRRYLAIAQSDVESAHRRASPADNWHL